MTETPAEQRLRKIAECDRHDAECGVSPALLLDADAIDLGREALAIVRRYVRAEVSEAELAELGRNLLDRCEGQ